MSVALTSPVTGTAQVGLTSPTYTVVVDQAPTLNGKQYAVTALGGTQTGVDVSSVQRPFTWSVFRPANFKQVRRDSNGRVTGVPKNTHKLITRKGVTVTASGDLSTFNIYTVLDVPAGAEQYDAINLRAALSLHAGALQQVASGLGDTVVSGVM